MSSRDPMPRLTLWEALDVLHLAWRLVAEAWLQLPYAIADEGDRLAKFSHRD